MEYSWSYSNAMQNLITARRYSRSSRGDEIEGGRAYPIFMTFDINREACEVPSSMQNIVRSCLRASSEPTTIAIPLTISGYSYTASGAETIIKAFSRRSNGDFLQKITTPKGEVYYGDYGLIMDKDFCPLLFSTIRLTGQEGYVDTNRGIIVHIHPRVFTDTEGVVNKSLLKKGIGYYLNNGFIYGRGGTPVKVQIDDSSNFFEVVHKPNVNTFSQQETTRILKENIDDVLNQISFDYGVNPG